MADGKIQVIMDKDDLQPLADSIKVLGDIDSNNELSLKELETIVNEKANNKLKTCTVTLVNNEAAVGCGYWVLKDGEPLYRSLYLPVALTPDLGASYDQLVATLDLDKVIVGSTFWIGQGTYASTTLPVKISGACQMAPGHTSVQPGNSFGCHIIIEGDCTITYG